MANLGKIKQEIEKKYGFSHPGGPGWEDELTRRCPKEPNGSVYPYEHIARDLGEKYVIPAFVIAGGRWVDGSLIEGEFFE